MTFVHPLPGGTDARNFGQDRGDHIHAGTDISAPSGTPLLACVDGVVTVKPWNGAAENTIDLRSDAGDLFRYFHLSSFDVRSGQRVTAGQQIGRVGSTGRSTGPHLHFEYHPGGGAPADPSPLLAGGSLPAGGAPRGATDLPVPVPVPGVPTVDVGLLANPRTWLRVTEVLGGAVLLALGLVLIVQETKVGRALTSAAVDAGKVAALGPAGAAL